MFFLHPLVNVIDRPFVQAASFSLWVIVQASAVRHRHTEQGPVSILINNAGNHCKKYIWEMSVEEYVSVLNVHLVGAFALTKALVPQMKELGRGRMIFQASMTSYIGQPQVAGYSTAKAGYPGLIHTSPDDRKPHLYLVRSGIEALF